MFIAAMTKQAHDYLKEDANVENYSQRAESRGDARGARSRAAARRRGLALGAEAVLIGRATLFGVCAGGEAGALRALDILRDELTRTMQLCGVQRIGDIDASLLAPR